MPKFEVDFSVYCSCGNGLCGNTTTHERNGQLWICVEPCEKCKQAAREEGRIAGMAETEADTNAAFEDGKEAGYREGQADAARGVGRISGDR